MYVLDCCFYMVLNPKVGLQKCCSSLILYHKRSLSAVTVYLRLLRKERIAMAVYGMTDGQFQKHLADTLFILEIARKEIIGEAPTLDAYIENLRAQVSKP